MRTLTHRGQVLSIDGTDGENTVYRDGENIGDVWRDDQDPRNPWSWHYSTTHDGATIDAPTFRAAVGALADATVYVTADRADDDWTASEGREHAAYWQSSGTIGHVLASFASGLPVRLDAILDDIRRTRADYVRTRFPLDEMADDLAELDHLSTYALALASIARAS